MSSQKGQGQDKQQAIRARRGVGKPKWGVVANAKSDVDGMAHERASAEGTDVACA